MFADDDIMTELGWTGVQCYVAIDPDAHSGEGDAVYADLNEQVVIDFVEFLGYTILRIDALYEYDKGWKRKDSLIHYGDEREIRARDLRVGDTFYEDEDYEITVAEMVPWGDNTLVHGTDDSRTSWDSDTVVRLVSRRRTA
jgi:hypothetical protein